MNKFKVGDRVRVYGGCKLDLVSDGTVESINGDTLGIEFDLFDNKKIKGKSWALFHYKQCRKLVKKKKINFINFIEENNITIKENVSLGEIIEYVKNNAVKEVEQRVDKLEEICKILTPENAKVCWYPDNGFCRDIFLMKRNLKNE